MRSATCVLVISTPAAGTGLSGDDPHDGASSKCVSATLTPGAGRLTTAAPSSTGDTPLPTMDDGGRAHMQRE